MRLTSSDVKDLPFCCALLDRNGDLVTSTPEWGGFALGALTFDAGTGKLVVIPDGCNPGVDELVVELVSEILAAGQALPGGDRQATEMLAAGLALVGGRLGALAPGTASDVVAYAVEGARRSVSAVTITVAVEVEAPVPLPAALGLGVLQLIRNAHVHAGATAITLRVTRGPTFCVEWPDESNGSTVATARRADLRKRWGLGFTRLLADSVGGVLTAPLPVRRGIVASSIGLGASRLAVPVAAIVGGRVERASRAWDEETHLPPGSAVDQAAQIALAAAASRPREIAFTDVYRARSAGSRTWLGIAPPSSLGRARDVLRGIQHENALLSAPEPHATRIFAIAAILSAVCSSEGFDAVSPAVWERDFPLACRAMSVDTKDGLGDERLTYPDPRVAAYLLGAVGGAIRDVPTTTTGAAGGVCIVPDRRQHLLVTLLGDSAGNIPLGK